uniref:Uncharacterized protein n=1 Tax=Loxodonta africana TaxID=9785 RepID=G3U693_LOXAF
MKKNAILLFKGSYIEESDFQDDVMVYRLCAEKDCDDTRNSQEETGGAPAEAQTEDQSARMNNGPLPSPQPETGSGEEHNSDNMDLFQTVSMKTTQENEPEVVAPESNSELTPPVSETEHSSSLTVANPESEDFIAQCDQIIKELDSGAEGLREQNFPTPEPLLLKQRE